MSSFPKISNVNKGETKTRKKSESQMVCEPTTLSTFPKNFCFLKPIQPDRFLQLGTEKEFIRSSIKFQSFKPKLLRHVDRGSSIGIRYQIPQFYSSIALAFIPKELLFNEAYSEDQFLQLGNKESIRRSK